MNSVPRLEALRTRLESDPRRAVLVRRAANVAYLTGFENVFDDEEAHAALVTSSDAWLYTDSRYAVAAQAAAYGTPWEVVVVRDNLHQAVCTGAERAGVSRLGVESSTSHGSFEAIAGAFNGTVESVSAWVEAIRCVKEPEEIGRIAEAQRLTDRAFDYVVGLLRVGRAERDIALELEFYMRKEGSEGVAFAPIVASGPNSALPHAKVTSRQLQPGDFVKLDFGARVHGYCADMTRTVVVGHATDRQIEIYQAVLAANLAGLAAVRGGVAGKAVDGAARHVIEERGFGERFAHGVGHGVGIEVHELPRVGPRAEESLLPGSVVTIEPGVYVPEYGGVRIEDLVVVETDGARVLTASPKDLLEV